MCDSDDILSPHGKPSEVAISSGMVQKLKSILYNRKKNIYIYIHKRNLKLYLKLSLTLKELNSLETVQIKQFKTVEKLFYLNSSNKRKPCGNWKMHERKKQRKQSV